MNLFDPSRPIIHERHIMKMLREEGWIGHASQLRALAFHGEDLRQRYENEASHAWAGNFATYKAGTWWEDMETAYGCGIWQQQGEAAHLIRRLLIALGHDAPKGIETCDECDVNLVENDHAQDCSHFEEGDE